MRKDVVYFEQRLGAVNSKQQSKNIFPYFSRIITVFCPKVYCIGLTPLYWPQVGRRTSDRGNTVYLNNIHN